MWSFFYLFFVAFFLFSKEIIIVNEEFLVACLFGLVLWIAFFSGEDAVAVIFSDASVVLRNKVQTLLNGAAVKTSQILLWAELILLTQELAQFFFSNAGFVFAPKLEVENCSFFFFQTFFISQFICEKNVEKIFCSWVFDFKIYFFNASSENSFG